MILSAQTAGDVRCLDVKGLMECHYKEGLYVYGRHVIVTNGKSVFSVDHLSLQSTSESFK